MKLSHESLRPSRGTFGGDIFFSSRPAYLARDFIASVHQWANHLASANQSSAKGWHHPVRCGAIPPAMPGGRDKITNTWNGLYHGLPFPLVLEKSCRAGTAGVALPHGFALEIHRQEKPASLEALD